ncbi:MAG: AMP-binding protein [Planctomycetes bacterium]|nr:AMP-binding protein [Planctomycetota bacterium]
MLRTTSAGGYGFRYVELDSVVESAAAALRAEGLRPGERVMLSLAGSPEWVVAFFAILRAGLIAVPILADTPGTALDSMAALTGARALVARKRTTPQSATRAGLCEIAIDRLLGATHAPGNAPVGCSGAATALLAFTSGSTARPRAVELTHASLLANLDALLRVRRVGPEDALLSMLPPAHLFELMAGLLAPLACGARVVYAGPPLPNRLIDALGRDRITHALTVPALLHALYEEVLEGMADGSGPRQRADLAQSVRRIESLRADELDELRAEVRELVGQTFRVLCVGGAAVDPLMARLLTPLGIGVEVGYGLSEASPIVSLGLASECPPGSVGRPLPGVEVRIDERAEIHVRGANVMRGYWGDPATGAEALAGGWLHTGDLGRLDDDGFLFVTGRLKEVMVTAAGETLHPEELEPYYASPLFAEHCVVPLKGNQGNDVPTLVIVPARKELTSQELQDAFVRLRASAPARCRVTSLVRLAAPLPRTALGKLRRRVLAEELSAEKEAQA